MKKRFISMLTILAMVLTLLPTAAYAQEMPGDNAVCACTVLCDGEHVNAACPVCAADNADLSLCVGTAKAPVDEQVQAVQSQIDALPTAAAVF